MASVSSIVSGRPSSEGPVTRLLRPVAYTNAPARASSTAMALPAPRVAPATRATRPSSGLLGDLSTSGHVQHRLRGYQPAQDGVEDRQAPVQRASLGECEARALDGHLGDVHQATECGEGNQLQIDE